MGRRRKKKSGGLQSVATVQESQIATPDAPQPAAFTIEKAGDDEASFVAVYELALELYREGGYATLDNAKASASCYGALKQGMTWLARDAAGEPIGAIAMIEMAFHYSQQTFLESTGFYVRRAWRGAPSRGRVGVGLLLAARKEAQQRSLIAFVTTDNPDRRSKATGMTIEAVIAGFVPLGYKLRIN